LPGSRTNPAPKSVPPDPSGENGPSAIGFTTRGWTVDAPEPARHASCSCASHPSASPGGSMAEEKSDQLDELYKLIEEIKVAMLTPRRPDGQLVARPMATQKRDPIADLWYVTDIESHKLDEL